MATSRDSVAYSFDRATLRDRIAVFAEDYNGEVDRYKRAGPNKRDVDVFVKHDRLKWSRDLKLDLQRGNYIEFDEKKLRDAVYRPFTRQHLFFDRVANEEVYVMPRMFPTAEAEAENLAFCATGVGAERPFAVMATKLVPDLNFFGPGTVPQWFPFYVYDEDGTNRRENITDWALAQFREHYKDKKIDKWAIFHYVYGLLHHPGYREKFADNLKRELPRIPFAPDFQAFAKAGQKLTRLHLDYEQLKPWDLDLIETPGLPLSYRVEDKMRLSKDKLRLTVNPSLTLAGIPPEAFEYRLGNRSALEWVIDQYQVSTDKRSGITSNPNRDDPEYIVRLVGQVIRVSVETVTIVKSLPPEFAPAA